MALCAGAGGLELGLHIALGDGYRTVVYVEREAYAAATLVARMEDEALDAAPVWDDLGTFDGRPWRGVVDIVSAGFSCQPWSLAGKRLGAEDERWIWPDIARVLRGTQPGWVFLENVPGLVRGGLELVLRDLALLGFDAEWGLFSAAEVGAPHKRERLFILARRGVGQADSHYSGLGEQRGAESVAEGYGAAQRRGEQLADADGRQGGQSVGHNAERGWEGDAEQAGMGGSHMANSNGGGLGLQQELGAECHHPAKPAPDQQSMGDPDGLQRSGDPREQDGAGEQQRADAAGTGAVMAHAHQGRRGAGERELLPGELDHLGIFPPGPGDLDAWRAVLEVAPGLEPAIRRMAHGLASRLDRLRLTGNGVVPVVAAVAFLALRERLRGHAP